MAGIQLPVSSRTTFTQIENQFSMQSGGKDHNIRASEGRGLYTSDKASLAGIKAAFGFSGQLDARAAKRDDGVAQIKQAIDNEYGVGMGDRVLQHFNQAGTDLSHGIKRSDLAAIRSVVDIVFQEKVQAAIDDEVQNRSTGLTHGKNDGPKLVSYMTSHFDVCSSDRFWKHDMARQNVDVFGSSLALSVLDRIVANNSASPKDINDLRRVLNPDLGHATAGAVDVSDDLQGPLTDDKLKQLAGLVYDRFVPTNAVFQLNLYGDAQEQADAKYVAADTGTKRLEAAHFAYDQSMASSGMHSSNLTIPLTALID